MKIERKTILKYIITVVALGLVIYVVPKVTDIFETTVILEPGTLQVSEEATCYFVREETVYEAGATGKVKYLIDEGTHIKTGTIIGEFTEDEESEASEPRSKYDEIIEGLGKDAIRTVSFEAQSSGVISYYADGYETVLTPRTMKNITYKEAKEIKGNKGLELKRKDLQKKEPLFKICDNDNWYIMCWIEAESISRYQPGNDITVELPEGEVKMTVESIEEQDDGDHWKVILWSNNYYEAFPQSRVEEGMLVSKNYEGLICDNSCLTTRDGKTGVMVKQKDGDFEFVQVKVIASDGEYSALRDVSFTDVNGNRINTVEVYDEILRKPGKGD